LINPLKKADDANHKLTQFYRIYLQRNDSWLARRLHMTLIHQKHGRRNKHMSKQLDRQTDKQTNLTVFTKFIKFAIKQFGSL